MTFQTLKFCFSCKKPVEIDKDRCPECGVQLKEHQGKKIFLSRRSGSENIPIHLTPGTILMDRFEIERFIDNGRYGSVYQAQDHLRSMKVALKVIDIGPSGNDQSILRARWEAKVYNRISDFSHIIKLCDTHTVPWGATGLLFLSMEFADGGTFREWLTEFQDDLKTRAGVGLDYFNQVCRGVLSLHNANAIHLDLKPENMVFSDGKLKIADFGTAMCGERRRDNNDDSSQTNQAIAGTPRYMAPECFDPGKTGIDQRADIYSLGLILYEVLHPKGQPPFDGTYAQLRDLHLRASIPQLPDTCEKLADAVYRCLAKNPENRYRSVAEFLMDLDGTFSPVSYENGHLPKGETKNSDQIEEVWQKADLSFFEGLFKDSSRFVEEVLILQPGHSDALQLREEINDRFRQADQLYREISQKLENGDLSELVDLMEEASEIYPEHPSGVAVQIRFSANAKRFRKSMETGKLALQKRQWGIALRYFSEASTANTGATQLRPMIEQLSQLEGARKRADIAIMNGDFEEAERLACFIDVTADQTFGQMESDQ